VTGRRALEHFQERGRLAAELADRYHTSFERLPDVLAARDRRIEDLEREVGALKHRLASGDTAGDEVRDQVDGVTVLARRAPEMNPAELRNLADTIRQKLGSGVVVLGMSSGGKATLLVAVTDDVVERVNAGKVVQQLAGMVGGRGGGKPSLAQAGGPNPDKIDDALRAAPEVVRSLVASPDYS